MKTETRELIDKHFKPILENFIDIDPERVLQEIKFLENWQATNLEKKEADVDLPYRMWEDFLECVYTFRIGEFILLGKKVGVYFPKTLNGDAFYIDMVLRIIQGLIADHFREYDKMLEIGLSLQKTIEANQHNFSRQPATTRAESLDFYNAYAFMLQGISLPHQGELQKGIAMLRRSLLHFKTLKDIKGQARVNEYLGRTLTRTVGIFPAAAKQAVTAFKDAIAIYKDLNVTRRLASVYTGIARLEYYLGNLELALKYYNQAATFFSKAHFHSEECYAKHQIGRCHVQALNLEKANASFSEALENTTSFYQQAFIHRDLVYAELADFYLNKSDTLFSARSNLEVMKGLVQDRINEGSIAFITLLDVEISLLEILFKDRKLDPAEKSDLRLKVNNSFVFFKKDLNLEFIIRSLFVYGLLTYAESRFHECHNYWNTAIYYCGIYNKSYAGHIQKLARAIDEKYEASHPDSVVPVNQFIQSSSQQTGLVLHIKFSDEENQVSDEIKQKLILSNLRILPKAREVTIDHQNMVFFFPMPVSQKTSPHVTKSFFRLFLIGALCYDSLKKHPAVKKAQLKIQVVIAFKTANTNAFQGRTETHISMLDTQEVLSHSSDGDFIADWRLLSAIGLHSRHLALREMVEVDRSVAGYGPKEDMRAAMDKKRQEIHELKREQLHMIAQNLSGLQPKEKYNKVSAQFENYLDRLEGILINAFHLSNDEEGFNLRFEQGQISGKVYQDGLKAYKNKKKNLVDTQTRLTDYRDSLLKKYPMDIFSLEGISRQIVKVNTDIIRIENSLKEKSDADYDKSFKALLGSSQSEDFNTGNLLGFLERNRTVEVSFQEVTPCCYRPLTSSDDFEVDTKSNTVKCNYCQSNFSSFDYAIIHLAENYRSLAKAFEYDMKSLQTRAQDLQQFNMKKK